LCQKLDEKEVLILGQSLGGTVQVVPLEHRLDHLSVRSLVYDEKLGFDWRLELRDGTHIGRSWMIWQQVEDFAFVDDNVGVLQAVTSARGHLSRFQEDEIILH